MDPLLYVVVTGICAIRQLFHTNPGLVHEIWSEVLLFNTPRGPCSALAGYLRKLNWIPSAGGLIDTPCGNQLNLQIQSTGEIRHISRLAWSPYVHTQVSHRKGITAMPGDAYTQIKTMNQLSCREQQVIALNITGGYQTAAVKANLLNVSTVDNPILTTIGCYIVQILPMFELSMTRQWLS